VQFQAAVALLARLRSVGAPAETIREHVDTLAALPIGADGLDGALLRWLARPGSLFGVGDDGDPDAAIERALAGTKWQVAHGRLEWEGLAYRVDIAATERARIRASRAQFASNALKPAVAILQFADDIPRALAAGELQERLDAYPSGLASLRDPGEVTWTGATVEGDQVHDVVRQVAARLRTVRPGDRRRVEQAARLLRRTADLVAADALAGLVYAVALEGTGALPMNPELPRRHRLEEPEQRKESAPGWDVPAFRQQESGSPYIAGSLLTLDVGVPEFGRRGMRTDRPQHEPNMWPGLAAGLRRTAALASAWTIDPDEIEAVEAARARGAAVAARWAADRIDARLLARGGIAGPRSAWVRWRLRRGEAVETVLSLEDVVRLGIEHGEPNGGWGAAPGLDHCLCLRLPAVSWEMRGRSMPPDVASELVVEPALRVAVELQRRALPSVLAPGVLALVTADLIEQSALPHPLDVAGIAEALRRVPPYRFDDYVAAVAARGPLVRIDPDGHAQAGGRKAP
jgi:hypothetical protein